VSFGQIKADRGRWVWPFAQMQPDDWFTVAHEDRDPERVRNMAMVRASQLKIRVKVEKHFQPGLLKVTRVDQALRIEDVMS
jgi:hypothetical protein